MYNATRWGWDTAGAKAVLPVCRIWFWDTTGAWTGMSTPPHGEAGT